MELSRIAGDVQEIKDNCTWSWPVQKQRRGGLQHGLWNKEITTLWIYRAKPYHIFSMCGSAINMSDTLIKGNDFN